MSREDFINWLDRPITNTDEKIINTLLEMIKAYDDNVNTIEKLMLKINELQKEKLKSINEDIEVLEV